ncbi:Fumarylacetoacetate hydrolase domain-containing protein 2 [Fusarium oxysporum f. sp. albedinis]|nr:Fumarylacetoacetate hydrolase domain-containing protein 2 [Fusarium oxysporum f. sp. albedinis]
MVMEVVAGLTYTKEEKILIHTFAVAYYILSGPFSTLSAILTGVVGGSKSCCRVFRRRTPSLPVRISLFAMRQGKSLGNMRKMSLITGSQNYFRKTHHFLHARFVMGIFEETKVIQTGLLTMARLCVFSRTRDRFAPEPFSSPVFNPRDDSCCPGLLAHTCTIWGVDFFPSLPSHANVGEMRGFPIANVVFSHVSLIYKKCRPPSFCPCLFSRVRSLST